MSMELSSGVIEMEKNEARQALSEYRAAVREQAAHRRGQADRELTEIDDAVMRGYRELGRGRRLIELSSVIAAGGVQELAYVTRNWRGGEYHTEELTALVPNLAVTRADARHCFTRGVGTDGSVIFRADNPQAERKADKVKVAADTFPEEERAPMTSWGQARAIVPQVPAPLRPNSHLRNYHILWEAEWDGVPTDPALLKHLGGDLYALLAVWDLSPLERAVLAGQRA
jgi:hypothetical protein